MRTRTGLCVMSFALGLLALGAAAGSREIVLDHEEMGTIFGSGNGKCCQIIPACRGNNTQTCNAFNGDQAGCLGSTLKGHYYTAYAKSCQSRSSCPNCDCSDYWQDADGKAYSCLDYYTCKYELGTCSDLNLDHSVAGATCADNCP